MPSPDLQQIRQLFDAYLRMYAGRDDRLTEYFSDDFSGFTGGGQTLVKNKAEWVAITRQDFAQVKDPLRIELKDVALQALADTIVVATGFFTIHLPIEDHILANETARLVLIFRREAAGWKIAHSSISIPYHLVQEGEIYPLKELRDRNQALERLVAERTSQLSVALERLRQSNEELAERMTRTKETEEALQRSEERYRSILNASPDDITIADMQGRILLVSPAAVPMFGFARAEDSYGLLLTDFIVPEDRPRALAQIALKREGLAAGLNEYRALRRDGSVFAIESNTEFIRDAKGIPTGMVVIVRDITKRKQTEEALHRSEERHRSILNASPDDITITDMQGRIIMVSPAAVQMFGLDRAEDSHGRLLTDFLVPADRARAAERIALKGRGIITGPGEYRAQRQDGGTFDVESNSEFIRDARGVPTGMVFIIRDVTERKQAERDRKRLELQNQQLQKSESLGRMAGAIAHHFNNQLQAVTLSLELAMSEQPANGGSMESLSDAMQAVRRASEVSTLMLTYLGQSLGKREPLDLATTCRRILSLLEAVVPNRVVLETDLPSPGPSILADANKIQQTLTNLVTNAWEASGDGPGVVRLSVKTVAAAKIPPVHRFPIDWQPEQATYACLAVEDQGCGIEVGAMEKLFDPFFTTKFIGRGLGLSVVLGVVREHEGVITVESEPGRGSCFQIFLPVQVPAVALQSAPIPHPVRHDGPVDPTEPITVLVVEDEPAVRRNVCLALSRGGLNVIDAKDGVEAVERFLEHRAEVDCVLCDLSMPRMNGWDTLTALRAHVPGIPVILASGFSEAQAMQGDHREWPQAYLQKPYDLETLKTAISRILPDRANDGRVHR